MVLQRNNAPESRWLPETNAKCSATSVFEMNNINGTGFEDIFYVVK